MRSNTTPTHQCLLDIALIDTPRVLNSFGELTRLRAYACDAEDTVLAYWEESSGTAILLIPGETFTRSRIERAVRRFAEAIGMPAEQQSTIRVEPRIHRYPA